MVSFTLGAVVVMVDLGTLTTVEQYIFIKKAKIENKSNNFTSSEAIIFVFQVQFNVAFEKNKFLLIRIVDDLEQVLFSCEMELLLDKVEYRLTIPKETLVKGDYKLNCIIYHPGITQYDNVLECCNFSIIDNIKAFANLETFDIGKVYIPQNWH